MKNLLLRILLVCAGMAGAFVAPANAAVEININRGNVQPLPIAITDFISTGRPSSRKSRTPISRRALPIGRFSRPKPSWSAASLASQTAACAPSSACGTPLPASS
jgi:Tol biopolymer transport system component